MIRLRTLLTAIQRHVDRRRDWLINIFDGLFLALLVLAIGSDLADGLRFSAFGFTISVRSTWRVVAWALVITGIRHALVSNPSLRARLWNTDAARAERQIIESSIADTAPAAARRRLAAVAVLFTAASVWMLFSQVVQPFSVPDHGDPLFSIWRLSWVAHQLPRAPLHLFDANIFYPEPRTLAYSDAMLIPAIAAAPLLWLGVHQVVVYNLIFFATIVLSGVTAFALVRQLTGRMEAALVSGVLFAFCAFRFSHFSHLELQAMFWMPLALLYLHRTSVTYRLRDGLLTGGAVALQGLSSLYYGIFLVSALACVAAVLSIVRQTDPKRLAMPILAGSVLALALLAPVTIPYWQNRSTVGDRGREEVLYYSALPSDYFVAHSGSVYYDATAGRGVRPLGLLETNRTTVNGERILFPGVVPLALGLAGLWPPFSPVRLAYAVGLAFAFDASLGLNGHAYPLMYEYIAPFRGLRVPARFAAIVALMLSVLAGCGAARLVRPLTPPALRYALAAALAVAAAVEARPLLTLVPVWKQPPSVYGALPRDRKAVIAELPFPAAHETWGNEHRFMYLSTFHWHRLVNGGSGFTPDSYQQLRPWIYEFPSEGSVDALRRRGVEYVVVNAKFYEGAEYARLITAITQRQDVDLAAAGLWEGSEVRLYRLRPPP